MTPKRIRADYAGSPLTAARSPGACRRRYASLLIGTANGMLIQSFIDARAEQLQEEQQEEASRRHDLLLQPQRGGDRDAQFTESTAGWGSGKTCAPQTKKNQSKHGCTRTIVAGTLTLSGYARANKVTFDGLLSNHNKLKPGSYTLTATATASGEHSTPATLHFTIVKR